jgi:choline kinase
MKAIILAAGIGRRFREVTDHLPKCLISLGDKTLLERALSGLSRAGVKEAVIVVGYRQEMVVQKIGQACEGVRVRYIVNEAYHKGAILSLWSAREEFDNNILIMDADVLFPVAMISRLVHSPRPNCFLLDGRAKNTGEEQMLLTRGGRVLNIVRGGSGDFDVIGESVGFLKVCQQDALQLRLSLEDLVAQGKDSIEHEEAFPLFLRRCEVGFEQVDDLPWIEIDFPEDLQRAESEILPRIEAMDKAVTRGIGEAAGKLIGDR